MRFEIMKRKVMFLQYILKQEESAMIYKVFNATSEHPIKNDFVQTCQKYLDTLDIKMTFDTIKKMSEYKFKKIVKEKTLQAAFKYLMEQKNTPGKHTKINNIEYKQLSMQEYLLEENYNTEISKLIFKIRGKTLDIKEHKKWKQAEAELCQAQEKLRLDIGVNFHLPRNYGCLQIFWKLWLSSIYLKVEFIFQFTL